MWENFFSALALVLVFEGILPFLKPDAWRRGIRKMTEASDRVLRSIGLVSMLIGVFLLYMIHA